MKQLFLRERNSFFYSIARHNDGGERVMVLEKVSTAIVSKPLEEFGAGERLEIENKAKPIVDKKMDMSEGGKEKGRLRSWVALLSRYIQIHCGK